MVTFSEYLFQQIQKYHTRPSDTLILVFSGMVAFATLVLIGLTISDKASPNLLISSANITILIALIFIICYVWQRIPKTNNIIQQIEHAIIQNQNTIDSFSSFRKDRILLLVEEILTKTKSSKETKGLSRDDKFHELMRYLKGISSETIHQNEQPIQSNPILPHHNEKIKFTTNIFVVCTILVIGVFAYLEYNGELNGMDYPLQPLLLHQNFTINSKTSTIHFDSFVFMHTNSLSSQNPIQINATLLPDQTDLDNCNCSWNDFPDSQIMIFEGASVYPPKYTTLANYPISGFVFLYKHNNPNYYHGNKTLIYESEGKHGYFLITTEQLQGAIGKTLTLTPDHQQKNELNASGIIIGSSDKTSVERSNNIVITLTLMIIALGIVQSREHIRDGFGWIQRIF